ENVVTPLDTRRCQRRGAEAHPPQRVTIAPLIPWPELHKGSLRLLSRVGFEDVAKHGAIAVEGRFRCESCVDSHVRVSFLRASHMPLGSPPTLMSRQKYALQSRNQICNILSSMSKRFSTFDRRYKVLGGLMMGVETAFEGAVAAVRFDREGKANALKSQLICGLESAANEISRRVDVAVVVLTGARTIFAAGVDLKDEALWKPGAGDVERVQAMSAGGRMTEAWRQVPQPVIAAIEGPA